MTNGWCPSRTYGNILPNLETRKYSSDHVFSGFWLYLWSKLENTNIWSEKYWVLFLMIPNSMYMIAENKRCKSDILRTIFAIILLTVKCNACGKFHPDCDMIVSAGKNVVQIGCIFRPRWTIWWNSIGARYETDDVLT